MPPAISNILFTVRRNLVSVLFPFGVSWSIYADWIRTQTYKTNKAAILFLSTQAEPLSISQSKH